jgi:hypothetical protein
MPKIACHRGIAAQTAAAQAASQQLPFPQAVQSGMRDGLKNGASLPQLLHAHLPLVPGPTLENFKAAATQLGEFDALCYFAPRVAAPICNPLPLNEESRGTLGIYHKNLRHPDPGPNPEPLVRHAGPHLKDPPQTGA